MTNKKKLSNKEKAMIGIIVILVVMLIFNWKNVSKGIKEGYNPIKKETSAN